MVFTKVYFANPLGFIALAAVPIIIGIHFLREKSRRVRVSTLFLLEQLTPQTPEGMIFHRLQNSIPLWLQLLTALLAAWLLVEPRWVRVDSTQQVHVLLDDTASMQAARDRVLELLPAAMERLARQAAATEWTIAVASRPESPLYKGPDLAEARRALSRWEPLLPHYDPARAFSLALLDAQDASILYVSDRRPENLPAGIELLAAGSTLENCGFAGHRFTTQDGVVAVEAVIKNSGATAQQRSWWIETPKTRTPPQALRLAPGEIATVASPIPAEESRAVVMLSADAFPLDDSLPLLLPQAKPFSVYLGVGAAAARFFTKIARTLPGVSPTSDPAQADLLVLPLAHGASSLAKPAIILAGSAPEAQPIAAPITGDKHPLTDGLSWQGLLPGALGPESPAAADQVLVWQGGRPLAFLRPGAAPRLVVNFDLEKSNADRLPATVVLMTRFLAEEQLHKPGLIVGNYETMQLLPSGRSTAGEWRLQVEESGAVPAAFPLRAPLEPGYFKLFAGAEERISGATSFVDTQEGDFRAAHLSLPTFTLSEARRRENTAGDPFAPLWLATMVAALVGSWALLAKGGRV